MAIYIQIAQEQERDGVAVYRYCGNTDEPGTVEIQKDTGEVRRIRYCGCDGGGEGHFRRVERKLRQHWDSGVLPLETCWAS